jgi:hypothetical protein
MEGCDEKVVLPFWGGSTVSHIMRVLLGPHPRHCVYADQVLDGETAMPYDVPRQARDPLTLPGTAALGGALVLVSVLGFDLWASQNANGSIKVQPQDIDPVFKPRDRIIRIAPLGVTVVTGLVSLLQKGSRLLGCLWVQAILGVITCLAVALAASLSTSGDKTGQSVSVPSTSWWRS